MAFMKGGKDITALSDLSYANDTRTKATFNTTAYWFNGGIRASKFPDAQFLTYASGYCYSTEALGGSYKKAGTNLTVAAKGCRPGTKSRWSSTSPGTYYINKFADGEVWVSATNNSRTGTRISTAEDNIQYMFATLGAGGGGGGGATLVASAGGGGGGGYAYACFKLTPGVTARLVIGSGGSRGESKEDGSSGGTTLLEVGDGFWAGGQGGGGGYGGGNNSGGGGYSGASASGATSSGFNITKTANGASGGARNNNGNTSAVNFTNHSPEQQQISYMTGSGGSGGGSSGGGGGGGSPLGNGGAAPSGERGSDGAICAGGGGGSYKAFNQNPGGAGGNGYCSLSY